jgi:uncharacterized repeat protein (TIGR03803 family)
MIAFRGVRTALLAAAFSCLLAASATAGQRVGVTSRVRVAATDRVLLSFDNTGGGSMPYAGLITDATGALYGTTMLGGLHHAGVVFKLAPPAAGQSAWTESVLYSFAFSGGDGGYPQAGVIAGADGALYGTTSGGGSFKCGGGCGTVFKLTPPAAGQTAWTESVIYAFAGRGSNDGERPEAGLIADSAGNFYGTTFFGGEHTLNCEGSPGFGCGTIFKLSPPAAGQTTWTETVIHSFSGVAGDGLFPHAALTLDALGDLYGTTEYGGAQSCRNGCGIAFELAPPAAGQTAWAESVLFAFTGVHGDGDNLNAGLIFDSTGALYGTTTYGGSYAVEKRMGAGTVFKLTPPPAGSTSWTETQLRVFTGATGGGKNPFSGVIIDGSGALYGTTGSGGVNNRGTVFKLAPPAAGQSVWTEIVLHSFAGHPVDGNFPFAGLITGPGGALYGTTVDGGTGRNGTVFVVP